MSRDYPSSRTVTFEGSNQAQGHKISVGSNSDRAAQVISRELDGRVELWELEHCQERSCKIKGNMAFV